MKLIKLDGTKDKESLAHEALDEVKKLMKEWQYETNCCNMSKIVKTTL